MRELQVNKRDINSQFRKSEPAIIWMQRQKMQKCNSKIGLRRLTEKVSSPCLAVHYSC